MIALALAGCETSVLGRLSADRIGDLSAGNAPRADYRRHLLEACGPGGLTPRGRQIVTRVPYLQRVRDTSAEILWTARAGDGHVVEVTEPGGKPVTETPGKKLRPIAGGKHQLRAAIAGLDPHAIYCYAIRDEEGVLLARTGFRTAPSASPGSDTAVQITAFGDMGKRSIDQDAVLRQLSAAPLDLAVLTGDIAYQNGTPAELEDNFFAPYGEMMAHIPFVIASGNHDHGTDDGAPLAQAFGLDRLYYSHDWGSIHLVVLDSERINREQIAWLDADLTANRLPWTIVALHKPPYSSGHHGGDSTVRNAFEPILLKHRVALVLAGHDHNYERTVPISGVTHIVTGGGGRGTRPVGKSWFTAHSVQVAHFVHITIAGQTATIFAVDGKGKTFDTAVIRL